MAPLPIEPAPEIKAAAQDRWREPLPRLVGADRTVAECLVERALEPKTIASMTGLERGVVDLTISRLLQRWLVVRGAGARYALTPRGRRAIERP